MNERARCRNIFENLSDFWECYEKFPRGKFVFLGGRQFPGNVSCIWYTVSLVFGQTCPTESTFKRNTRTHYQRVFLSLSLDLTFAISRRLICRQLVKSVY